MSSSAINGIETYLLAAQFQWTGHWIQMDNHGIPKYIFYSQLAQGLRSCGQYKRYKDSLKANL